MEMNINGDLIKALRLQKSWSQEKLADIAGLSLRTVQRIETDGIASLKSRVAISTALQVEPCQLDLLEASPASDGEETASVSIEPETQKNTDAVALQLRRGLRFVAFAVVWTGIGFSAFLIFFILVAGIFFWEATPFTFWESVGGGLIGAAVFVPVLLFCYFLYRYLKRSVSGG